MPSCLLAGASTPSVFITSFLSLSQPSPQLPLCPSFLLSARQDTLTRNGLRCFPAPVNRLPACEGIDGFDIRCCLTQKRRGGPWDGPFLTLHIHHAGQSNEWDAGAPPREAEQSGNMKRKHRGKEEGVRLHSSSSLRHPATPHQANVGGSNNEHRLPHSPT